MFKQRYWHELGNNYVPPRGQVVDNGSVWLCITGTTKAEFIVIVKLTHNYIILFYSIAFT